MTSLAPAPNAAANKLRESLATGDGASMVGFRSTAAGAVARSIDGKLGDEVSVRDFGAVGDGITDDSAAIAAAHAVGRRVFYPNGRYLFTSQNLDLSGGIRRESESGTVFTNGRYDGVVAFDRGGALIGLHQNHLEVKATGANPTPAITSGNIVAPPESKTAVKGAVDVIAYWYQDFGLDAARDSGIGAHKWYTWEWAHTDSPVDLSANPKERGYLPGRHPMLGWYRGEDQNVLDWQCYWLREAGVSAAVVQPRGANKLIDTATWAATSDINNWIYKLLNTVPNARGLGFVTWCDEGNFGGNYGDATALANIEAAWDSNIQVLHDSGRAYTVSFHGGCYLLVYLYDGDSLRGDFDNYVGSSNVAAMLARRAAYTKGLGYAGIAVMARHATTNATMNRGALLNAGVLYFGAGYATTLTGGTDDAIYSDYADAVAAWKHDSVPLVSAPGVHIEALSSGHPSDWGQVGSTPDLFRQMLDRAVRYAATTPNAPKIVTIYNVSEWAEGGASLQPTVGNGWAYLDAVRQVLNASSRDGVPQETHSRNFKPTAAMAAVGPRIGISSDFNQTFAMTPMIAAGAYEGQTVTVVNYDQVGAHTITLADDSATPGTGVFFRGGTSKALAPWQSVDLRWWPAKGWVEV